jgi:hypothetical protein
VGSPTLMTLGEFEALTADMTNAELDRVLAMACAGRAQLLEERGRPGAWVRAAEALFLALDPMGSGEVRALQNCNGIVLCLDVD